MKFTPTGLGNVTLIEPEVFSDDRGFFLETYRHEQFVAGGIDVPFVQHNHSRSVRHTLRGLHAQLRNPQAKLIRVIEGEIFDVAVDIRRESSTFGRWSGSWLSAENFRQLYVPAGFAHGFCVTSAVAQVEYKCSTYYDPGSEIALRWNDPTVNIQWPDSLRGIGPILSEKDRTAKSLSDLADVLSSHL